jgi:hypothetical protein
MLENKTNLQTRLKLVENELENLRLAANLESAYTDHLTMVKDLLVAYDPTKELTSERLNEVFKKILTDMGYTKYYIDEVVAEGSYAGDTYPMQALYDFRQASYKLMDAFNDGPFTDAVNDVDKEFPFSKSFDEWITQDLEPWIETVGEAYADNKRILLNEAEERGWSEFNMGGGCMVWFKNIHCKDNHVRAVGVNNDSIVLYNVTSETVGESSDDEVIVFTINYHDCEQYISKRQFAEILSTQENYCIYYDNVLFIRFDVR